MVSKIIDADGIQRSGVLIGNTLHITEIIDAEKEQRKQIEEKYPTEKYVEVVVSNWEMK